MNEHAQTYAEAKSSLLEVAETLKVTLTEMEIAMFLCDFDLGQAESPDESDVEEIVFNRLRERLARHGISIEGPATFIEPKEAK